MTTGESGSFNTAAVITHRSPTSIIGFNFDDVDAIASADSTNSFGVDVNTIILQLPPFTEMV